MSKIFDLAIDGYKDVQAKNYIGIFGHPVKHTLSPVIHDTLSLELGLSERYIPFHVEPELDLGACVQNAFDEGILGLNITVPYKQKVMETLVAIDPAARAIGAVNTLVRMNDGYKGYNTDMPGLAKALESEGISLKDEKVIMLGAGGAARAVAYMCMRYGAKETYILNRTFENAKKIADDMNEEFRVGESAKLIQDVGVVIPVSTAEYESIPKDKYIFIQCTSIGLRKDDGMPLVSDDNFFKMAKAGVDLIYNPAKTSFIQKMDELGIRSMNGLKMLLYQGVMAYELWNGVEITESQCELVYHKLYDAVYEGEKNKKGENIVLVGYMGAGKTTVGSALAESMDYQFLDTDAYIVEKAGMSINEIFSTYGEAYFRDFETKCLKELENSLTKTIVSTGGGVPLRDENVAILKNIGKVYYLRANADTIYERVKDSTDRPLLQCDDPKQKIKTMLEDRNLKYEGASDVIIDTDSIEYDAVIDLIKFDHDREK